MPHQILFASYVCLGIAVFLTLLSVLRMRAMRAGLLQSLVERERLRREVEQAEEGRVFLEQIINSVADPIFVKDRQHRYTFVNDAHCEFFSHKREELLGKSDKDFFPAEQVAVFWGKDDEVFQTGQQDVNEEIVTLEGGHLRTMVTKKALYTNKAGEPLIVGIVRDVTERKAAEEEVRKLNAELEERVAERTADLEWTNDSLEEDIAKRRAVEKALMAEKERLVVALRSISDGVIATDAERRIQLMNRVAENYIGWQNDEVINRPLEQVLRLDGEKSEKLGKDLISSILPRNEIIPDETRAVLTGRNGEQRAVLMKVSPIRGQAGEVLGLVVVFREY